MGSHSRDSRMQPVIRSRATYNVSRASAPGYGLFG